VRASYRRDYWASLPHHVEVFVEKDAVAGTVEPVTEEHNVALRVVRGYVSVSFARSVADLWRRVLKPIFAYYLGDYDPSGFDLERCLRERLSAYCGRPFAWTRLGVVGTDFGAFGLLPLPAKAGDSRTRKFLASRGSACAELDALPPNEIRRRVREAVEGHIDGDTWNRLCEIERLEREAVARTFAAFGLREPGLGPVSGEGGAV
jgi:hypothetical protein